MATIVCGALLLASPAVADTYCVGVAGCDLSHTFGHLQGALNASSTNAVNPDTVRIGPVTLADGPFISSSPVDIVGAGVGQTVLTNPAGTTQPVLSLTGEGNETVADLSIRLAPSTGSFVPQGLVIYGGVAGHGVAERLDISAPGPLNAVAIGAVAGNGATLRDSTVAVAPADGSIAVSANGGATVERSTLTGSVGLFSGVTGYPPPHWTNVGRYLDITAHQPAAAEGSTLKLQSSLLRAPGPFSIGLWAKGDEGPNESAAIEATNVTVVGDGSAGGVGIRAQAAQNEVPRHADATVLLRNSILYDFAQPIVRNGQDAGAGLNAGAANVEILNSLYDRTIAPVESGPGALTSVASLGPLDPGFVGPGDFHLAAGSPLIDAGDSSALPETDLDGAARALDGNGDGIVLPDIGAYERAALILPGNGPVGSAAAGAGGDTTAPRLTGVSLSHRRFRVAAGHAAASAAKVPAGTSIRFTLSEPAAVGVRFERAARSGRAGCAKAAADEAAPKGCTRWIAVKRGLTVAGFAAGPGTIAFDGRVGRRSLHPDRYRATLLPTDAAGNAGAGRTIGFRIVAR